MEPESNLSNLSDGRHLYVQLSQTPLQGSAASSTAAPTTAPLPLGSLTKITTVNASLCDAVVTRLNVELGDSNLIRETDP